MHAVAIDFETANERRDSACAIGLAFIDDGVVTRREYRLIRPPEMRFHPGNIRVHGIYPEHVMDEPEFPDIWREFARDVTGRRFIAHNASFDSAVLAQMLARYQMPPMRAVFSCTVQMARMAWPELPSHRLNMVSEFLGISLRHHHAGDDAYACAQIAIAAARELGETAFSPARVRAPRRGAGGAGGAGVAMTPGFAAGRRGGAARAARPAQDAPAPVIVVRGSRGDSWEVRVGVEAGARTACNCPAGQFRRICRHVRALADGVVDHVIRCENIELADALRYITRQLG